MFLMPAYAFSQTADGDIMIVEIQTGTTNSASEEFVELYNASDQNVDISHYKVEYYSATSDFTTPSRSIPLHGTLYAGKHYLLASTGYLANKVNDSFSAGFSKMGGHIRLISPDPSDSTKKLVHDLVGWGTALHPEDVAAPALPDGSSLLRKTDTNGHFIDTDNNSDDFAINPTPTPIADNVPPESGGQPSNPDPNSGGTTTPPENDPIQPPAAQLLPLQITELLPNPAPPASDSLDEYVELYNPNDEPLDLNGYKLQTGKLFSYSHTFSDGTIPARTYQAHMVTETRVLLANSGGKARLIDQSGTIVSETDPYDNAANGQAWALVAGAWDWTTTPTPNEANILTAPLAKQAALSSTSNTKTPKKTAVKAANTKKSASGSKKSSKSSASAGSPTANTSDPAGINEPAALHPAVLAGVSALAVGYAAYEYRHDMANRLYQFRRYRTARREARAAAKGA